MNEFTEVMRTLERMCQYHRSRPLGCRKCPLAGANTAAGTSCFHYIMANPAEALEIIRQWNEVYPTWRECFGEGFPDEPIPADVADKLGVKPHTRQEE